jgi:hypothetical protein
MGKLDSSAAPVSGMCLSITALRCGPSAAAARADLSPTCRAVEGHRREGHRWVARQVEMETRVSAGQARAAGDEGLGGGAGDWARVRRPACRVRALTAAGRHKIPQTYLLSGVADAGRSVFSTVSTEPCVRLQRGVCLSGRAEPRTRPTGEAGRQAECAGWGGLARRSCRLTGRRRTCILRHPCVGLLAAGGPYCLYFAPVENLPWR